MKRAKYFSQEIGPGCNLAKKHRRCPLHSVDIYLLLNKSRIMDDETILNNIRVAYANGFNGFLNWSFYNEPLLYMERLERLHGGIKKINPDAKIVVWTNGTMIGRDVDPQRLDIFSHVVISNYERRDWSWFVNSRPNVTVLRDKLDNRMDSYEETRAGCKKVFGEFIIDAYGNWRLCCGDWMGTAVNMNVHEEGIQAIINERARLMELVSQDPQPAEVPTVCKYCRIKGGYASCSRDS